MSVTGPPVTLWIRHRHHLHWRHIACQTAKPYSSVALGAWQSCESLSATEAVAVHDEATNTTVRIYGDGSRGCPMYCPELQDGEFSECGCEEILLQLAEHADGDLELDNASHG